MLQGKKSDSGKVPMAKAHSTAGEIVVRLHGPRPRAVAPGSHSKTIKGRPPPKASHRLQSIKHRLLANLDRVHYPRQHLGNAFLNNDARLSDMDASC